VISSPEKFDVLLPRAPATDDSGKKGKLKKKIKVVTTDETK
jgi:hypothetical protein